MPDQLETFFTRLGMFRNPMKSAGDACGCDLGESNTLGESYATEDATQAVSLMLAKYTELSLLGNKLAQILQGKGKIPCEVWRAYADARQDYMTKSTELLNQLAAREITIHQTVWSQGKPVMDATDPNKVKTVFIQAPLRPPSFAAGAYAQCVGIGPMYGVFAGEADIAPSPYGLGALPLALVPVVAVCTAATAGACVVLVLGVSTIVGIASYAGYKSLQQIGITVRDYVSSPAKTVSAYTDCVSRLTASGFTPAQATEQCMGSQTAAQQHAQAQTKAGIAATGLPYWVWGGIAVGLLVGGYFLISHAKQRIQTMTAPMRALESYDDDFSMPRRRRRARS